MTIGQKILDFYSKVKFTGLLPDHIGIMNPYQENCEIRLLCDLFYNKFYDDNNQRTLILGINPGRLGAGATGIPFTDTKRLNYDCGILYNDFSTHEPSSVFIYEMIRSFGGPKLFYSKFYINSVCPLGFIKTKDSKSINYNYYDSKELELSVNDFIIDNIRKQIEISGNSELCYCLGTGKNYQYLYKLNEQHHFFYKIIPLEHPRYIMQYKNKEIQNYIELYIKSFMA